MPISRSNKPTILITMGDPAGIGPEVVLKSLASPEIFSLANFLVIGDRFVLDKVSNDLGLKLKVSILDLSNVPPQHFSYGKSKPSFGKASLEYVDKALELLKRGEADSLVTGPVNKRSIEEAGLLRFRGHTEYLALKTQTKDYAMMFVGKDLKVVLATRHIALKSIPRSLSVQSIYKTIIITHRYLKRFFNIDNPKIGVAGLNPHAGEKGLFGIEEKKTIIPAIKRASKSIKYLYGPIPPDVLFYQALNKRFDVVIAMYHDQGLIPFKTLYFNTGVNLTLGLPFVRTSPDHGTALDIAGKGIANPTSITEAILLAHRLASK